MNKIANIAKNTSYLTFALILQKIISFTYFALLARYIGPANLGKYYLAIAFTTIFAVFIDLGLANVLTREIAKNQERASHWLSSIVFLKLPLVFLSVGAIFLLINILDYDQLTRHLVYIAAIAMVLDSFTSTFFALIRGFHNLKYESIAAVLFQLIVLLCGYGALLSGADLTWAMAAVVLASLYSFIYSWVIIKYRLRIVIRAVYDWPFIKEIVMIAWPFAVYGILQRVYFYLDSVLLSVLASDIQVGLYQVAFKIIFALQFLPIAFTASLYPAMSAYWHGNRQQLLVSFERALSYLIIISLPIVVGIFILADQVVLLFTADYATAVWPLRISIISLFFIFLNFPIGSLLNACDAQRQNTVNMFVVTVASVILNILLIPVWQALGASWTVLVTNILMFILGLRIVKQIIPYRITKSLPVMLKSLVAALLMGVIIFFGREQFNIFLVSLVGAGIYFFFLFALGGLRREDLLSVYQSFKRQDQGRDSVLPVEPAN